MASDKTYRPIGYAWLAEASKVAAMPHFVESFVAEPGERKTIEQADGRIREIHPWTTIKLKSACDHLEFALKREGLHIPHSDFFISPSHAHHRSASFPPCRQAQGTLPARPA